MGWDKSERWGLRLYSAWLFLTSSSSRMTWKIFLPHPRPLGPVPSCKTLLVNLPSTIAIVFNKTYFVNKSILEIKNKFIKSNQTNFQQKLNNIIKVFNKTISQQKQKSHNTKPMIQQYINLFITKTKENVKIGTSFSTLLEKKKGRNPCWVE